MKHRFALRSFALVALLALVLAACGGDPAEEASGVGVGVDVDAEETTDVPEEPTEMDTEEHGATGSAALDASAVVLTRDLTGILTGHEYLAGDAVYMAVKAGGNLEDPGFKAAATALDNNTVQLADVIGSVYGDEAREQFLQLWRNHIGFFVDYTLGKATNDQQMVQQAAQKLDGYRQDFGAFIDGATNGAIPQSAVAEALQPHVDDTKKAIDLVVSGEGNPFSQLRVAAGHMPMISTALAGGIAQAKNLEGQADSAASGLQRDLTYLLEEHEYLAGAAVLTAVQAGGDLEDPTFKAAAAALDENSVALADAIGSVYGPEGREQFLQLWRNHIGFFVDYTLAKASNDQQKVEQARQKLDGYRQDFGAFIEGATEGGLTQDQVAAALEPHVNMTFEAIDAIVTGEGNGFEQLREAANHMPAVASALAAAIVAQHPDKFAA